MTYTTKHLKSNSYESFLSECEKVGLVSDDGEIITASHNHSLILLPDLYAPTGRTLTDSEGYEYHEMKALGGFHANIKYKVDVGLNHLAVEVDTPLVK